MGALKPLSLSSYSILRAIRPFVAPLKPSASSPRRIIVSRSWDRGYRCSLSAMKGRCLSTLVETVMEYESDRPCDDGRLMKREATLHFALSQLAGDFDKESNLSLQRFFCTRRTPVISTGSLKLDMALGAGGLPKGRMIEIYGTEASGKTTLALHIVKEAQKLGGYCAYLDVENAMNPSLAEAMGVHTDNLLIAHPNSAENTLNIVNTLVNSGSVDVIVVDSVAALIPQRELDGMIGDHSRDMQARLMTQALRKIHYSLSRSQTLIIFINQVRMNPKPYQHFDQMSEVTCGGNALKFYAAIRMRISRRGLLQTHDEVTGITIAVQVMKNKLAPAMKKATLDIGFGKGILQEAEVLEMASKHGIISQEGSGYWINGEFFTDQPEAERYLLDNSSASEELVSILRNQLFEMRA